MSSGSPFVVTAGLAGIVWIDGAGLAGIAEMGGTTGGTGGWATGRGAIVGGR